VPFALTAVLFGLITLTTHFTQSVSGFGCAVLAMPFGVQGLANQIRPGRGTPRPWPAWLLNTLLFIGGTMQGAFTSGGPPVIIYAIQKLKDKASFRATLVAIWTTLNMFIVADIVVRHKLSGMPGKLVLTSLPFLALGALLGDIAHHRISGERFTQLIYAVLLISAVFMVL